MINLDEKVKRSLVRCCWDEMLDEEQAKIIGIDESDLEDFYDKAYPSDWDASATWIEDNIDSIDIDKIDIVVEDILNSFFVTFIDNKTGQKLSKSKLTGKETLVCIDFPADLTWDVYLDNTYMGQTIKEKAFSKGNLYINTSLEDKKEIILECFDRLKLGGELPLNNKQKIDLITNLNEEDVDNMIIKIINKNVKFKYVYASSLLSPVKDIIEDYDVKKLTGKELIIDIYLGLDKTCTITLVEDSPVERELKKALSKMK